MELGRIVDGSTDAVRPAAKAKGIALAPESIGPVLGDHDRLQQVLWNLLATAIEFIPVAEIAA